jgi:hypothetical protein
LRYYLRQEPSAVIPLAGIRGGGGQQWSFLLRPLFIALEGIRDVADVLSAAAILERTGIEEIRDQHGESVRGDIRISTRNWLRPELRNHRVVLEVTRAQDGSLSVEKRKKNQDDM